MNEISSKKKIIILAALIAGIAVLAIYYFYAATPLSFWPGSEDAEKKRELEDLNQKIDELRAKLDALGELSSEELAELEQQQKILAALEAAEDAEIPGVAITKKSGRKIIENQIHGYSIELPENLVLARSVDAGLLGFYESEFFCQGDPSCPPALEISAEAINPERLEIGKWLEREEELAGTEIYSPREKIIIGATSAYRVRESIPRVFEGFYYYFGARDIVVSIRAAAADDEKYREFINTFRFK